MTTLPEWANWLARDGNGKLYTYSVKPLKVDGFWDLENSEDSCIGIEKTDDTFSHIKWTDEEPTKIKRGLETGGVSVEELNRITNAKAHGYDEVPTITDKTEPVYIDIDVTKITVDEPHSIFFEDKTERVHVDKDGAEITVGETTSISFEDAMDLVENRMENEMDDIADKRYETPDIINEPNHYKGKHGIETIDVIRNFGSDDMVAGFYWGNAIKYMTRYRNKNGLEDLKKARRNLDWLIEHMEKVEQ